MPPGTIVRGVVAGTTAEGDTMVRTIVGGLAADFDPAFRAGAFFAFDLVRAGRFFAGRFFALRDRWGFETAKNVPRSHQRD